MSDLDLIDELGELLGRPLEEISEGRFERHAQGKYLLDGKTQNLIARDTYCLAKEGTVSGVFLQPATSELLFDFPLEQFKQIKHLYLNQVNLRDYSFLAELTGLKSLDLSNNKIKNASFLAELVSLKSLVLSNNQISNISFLEKLKDLNLLALGDNQIGDFSFLARLEELTVLDLGDEKTDFIKDQIIDTSFLAKLKNLKVLNLSRKTILNLSFPPALNGLTALYLRGSRIPEFSFLPNASNLKILDLTLSGIDDGSFLSKLNTLESLFIGDNDIDDFSFLKQLKGLTSLCLNQSDVADTSVISGLKGLKFLNLSSSHIGNISFISELKELVFLDLCFLNYGEDDVVDISVLAKLKNLAILNLASISNSDFSFLRELRGLTALDLRNNHISDASFLGELKGLTSLTLSGSQIGDCSSLKELEDLTSLTLRNHHGSDLSFLGKITALTSLDLSGNQISDCSFLAELKELTSLYLSDNRISNCSFLSKLKGLTLLDLGSNKISRIPQWLANSRLAIKADNQHASSCINLYNNPIEKPPIEIVRQGNAAILNYYAQLAAQGQDRLYEAKMLIVGEGEAGKTTLAHKITEPMCPLPHVDDRTRGIGIQTYRFTCRDRNPSESSAVDRNFHLNIWDFGGQEIYHYTHRFFLSKRSLYVLVADNRKDDTDFNYWLNIIELFAGNSPLIIVLNEKGDVQRSLNRADLLSRYPNSIKDILSVNFKTHEEPDAAKAQERLKSIRTLIGEIEHCAQNLPHIGEPVPARWVDVRQAIEQDERNHITREQFDELCNAQEITNHQDTDTLLGYFHDLGIVLHFDQPFLRKWVILNPTWATNAVYRIFDDDSIKAKAGRFTRDDCAQIWSDSQYRHMGDVLIELMKNFRLVYEIGTTGNLVAPQLLPPNTPTYPWDESQTSHMQLRYDAFMPKGIFWQFAVTMYRYIPNHDWVWRNGMVICRDNTWAEVKEDLNLRRISLRFYGPSIAEFRAVIVDELDSISQAYHRLHYDKMIPCQCSECKGNNQPHFFTFSDLKKRQEQRKKTTIECVKSTDDVPLSTLLDGFEIRDILAKLPDKKGGDPSPPEHLDTDARIVLVNMLSALPQPQFDQLLFALNPPSGIVSSGAQAARVVELLKWVEGTGGKGFQSLLKVLEDLNIPIRLPM